MWAGQPQLRLSWGTQGQGVEAEAEAEAGVIHGSIRILNATEDSVQTVYRPQAEWLDPGSRVVAMAEEDNNTVPNSVRVHRYPDPWT